MALAHGASPVPAAPTAKTAGPVRIFSVGQPLPSGKIADERFIDRVVANWSAYQQQGDPRFKRPRAFVIPAASVSIGHEDNSSIARAYADRSDLPAVGWPTGLYRDGKYLCAEGFKGVPVPLAAWINAGSYSDISAEFYEDYEGFGPCLRRISLLGGDIPACSDLGDMPTLVFDPEAEADPNPLAFSEALSAFARGRRTFGVRLPGPGGGRVVTFPRAAHPVDFAHFGSA